MREEKPRVLLSENSLWICKERIFLPIVEAKFDEDPSKQNISKIFSNKTVMGSNKEELIEGENNLRERKFFCESLFDLLSKTKRRSTLASIEIISNFDLICQSVQSHHI